MADPFICLGTPVRADETRSAAVCTSADGKQLVVLAARGYVVIVDPETGDCRQTAFPERLIDYPFGSIATSSGLFITGAGPLLMVLDPFLGQFIRWFRPAPEEEIIGMAFAEDREGTMYATTYPGCKLLRLELSQGQVEELVQLDPLQKYAMTLAASEDGWIYAGIGTQTAVVAGFEPRSGALRKVSAAGRGAGEVHLGEDGQVYAALPAAEGGRRWFRMARGEAVPMEGSAVAPSLYFGTGYNKLHRNLSGRRRVMQYQLAEGELVLSDGESETALPLSYEGNGTALSPMFLGPDGRIYGTSNHPLHLYSYEPGAAGMVTYGGKTVEKGGGGNICAYASQGELLFGAAYAGGHLHVLDTTKPLAGESGGSRNPRLLYSNERIHRPRCMLAHPDGEHVLYGGFPGYGMVGGALGVLHVPTESVTVYEHHELCPYQSTLGLAALSCGDVIGATSVETPGGAEPIAKQAELYRFDWKSRAVSARWAPVPGAKEISMIAVDRMERIHGLTSDSIYFVFDTVRGEPVYQQDLSAWGQVVRHGLIWIEKQGMLSLVGLLSGAIFEVDPNTYRARLIATLPKPATSGIAYKDGFLYFGCGCELWTYRWMEGSA
ncbi:hypothetical protein [Paenibacillus silviterrae]|uniref:hypothetical protein n=1 Tax=Paenibacillus silviterrae TaxID=3242194 RepID=UPI0025432310|nr:hypothetical protein [Paenibacillus chinjuensis]